MVRKAPQAARNRHVASQVAAEQSFYRQYDARMTVANNDMSDEHAQWLWHDADWRKWEQEEPWLWEEMERQRWAEDIFRQQVGLELLLVVVVVLLLSAGGLSLVCAGTTRREESLPARC